jgi:TPP-dependent pyruvate/acetoin dehydrogenase alpha subunit
MDTSSPGNIPTEVALSEQELERALYTSMLRIRLFEDACQRLFMQNLIEGSLHLYQGQEAVAVGVCSAVGPDARVAATYRGHGVALALGCDPTALFAELLGRRTGVCGGRAGSMNVVDLAHGLLGCFAIVGGSIACATGAALAAKLRHEDSIAVAFFGDGAVNQAYFHESLNFAGVEQLPVLYVCENNQYSEFSPMQRVTAGGKIAARAAAYGFPGVQVDGNDVFAVRATVSDLAARIRSGQGPILVECETYRHKGHSRHDDPRRYRPEGELEAWLARDPLPRAAEQLPADEVAEIQAQVRAEIDDALVNAQEAPFPDVSDLGSATKEVEWRS